MTVRWSVPLFGIFLIASAGGVSAAPADTVRDAARRGFDRNTTQDSNYTSPQPVQQVAARRHAQLAQPDRAVRSGGLGMTSRSYSNAPDIRPHTRADGITHGKTSLDQTIERDGFGCG